MLCDAKPFNHLKALPLPPTWGSPGTDEGTRAAPLPQFSSSDLSLQSGSRSQRQLEWMHSPLRQWNSRAEQGLLSHAGTDGWGSPQRCGHSSEPSSQSGSPSQAQSSGMQVVLLHWKLAGPQVGTGQDTSSEPSKQSRSESQTNFGAMHLPSLQRNSSWEHVLGAAGTDRRRQPGQRGASHHIPTPAHRTDGDTEPRRGQSPVVRSSRQWSGTLNTEPLPWPEDCPAPGPPLCLSSLICLCLKALLRTWGVKFSRWAGTWEAV